MPARWAFAIWGMIYVGEVCAYGKILMGEHQLQDLELHGYHSDYDLMQLDEKKKEEAPKVEMPQEAQVFTWCKNNLRDC